MTLYFENECDGAFPSLSFDMEKQLRRLVEHVTAYVRCPYETEVSVTIVSKTKIHHMNREFRQVDKATDVLSFPMMEYEKPGDFASSAFMDSIVISPETEELVLGDIVLCADIIVEQAQSYGHSILREFSFLVVHSLLHLFGYDHIEEEERLEMEAVQRKIMEQLDISR